MGAFDFDDGVYQGRIPVANAPQGASVYELGHALPHQFVRLSADDDSTSLVQDADYSTTPLTRVRVSIRAPSAMPANTAWVVVVGAGFVASSQRVVVRTISRSRTFYDLAIPTRSLTVNGITAQEFLCELDLLGADGLANQIHTPGSQIVTVELPSVQFDAVVLDTTTQPVVIANRDPEPNEVEVPVGSGLSIDLLSTTGAAVDTTKANVWVAGVQVVSAGVQANGWTASFSALPDVASHRLVLTPPVSLSPFTVYSVRVTYTGIDTTYTFRTVDTIGPSVVGAVGTDEREVRVTWSEAVTGTGSYSISLVSGVPAVTPLVLSAVQQADGSVLLTLDTEQTPGAVYRVTAAGVTDLLGNAIVVGTATFTGYQCPSPADRDFDLYSMLLEEDRRQDESGDLKSFVGCYQEVTNLLLCKIDRLLDITNADTASEAWLDVMLRDLGNPFPFDLTLAEKRKLVRLLVDVYRLKGTDVGIISAVRLFLGIEITITTPWRTGWRVGVSTLGVTTILASDITADIYSFNVVSTVALTADQRKRITTIVRYMMRAPCHLRAIIEPTAPAPAPNHWELGRSRLGTQTLVH